MSDTYSLPSAQPDTSLARLGRQIPSLVTAVLALAIVGFGSGAILSSRYNGLVVQPSKFLTVVGLFALCLAGAKIGEWAFRRMTASEPQR